MRKFRNLMTQPFFYLAALALLTSARVSAAVDTDAAAILSKGTDTVDAAKAWGIAIAGVIASLTFVFWMVSLMKRKGKM